MSHWKKKKKNHRKNVFLNEQNKQVKTVKTGQNQNSDAL